MMEERPVETSSAVVYLSSVEAAAKLGCAVKTVTRAARAARCGVYTNGGTRLAAISPLDLPRLRPHIHASSGNPVWIAAKRIVPKTQKRSKPSTS
jgi:hypothetical protein